MKRIYLFLKGLKQHIYAAEMLKQQLHVVYLSDYLIPVISK